MPAVTLADVIGVLDELYPPGTAEAWDAVGLVCGDPTAEVRRVLLAVDPVAAVGDEAIARESDLLVTHHPLFLRPVHGVAATTAKGRLVHRLVGAGVALHVAHTNADVADPGVSDALANVLGLVDVVPLQPQAAEPLDKVVTFVPHADAARVLDALAEAGAGALGDYTRCAWTADGLGTFRPEVGASPTIGVVGRVEEVPETRIEMVLARTLRPAVVRALLAAHPYEEPAYDVVELAPLPGRRGLGRLGALPTPEPLEVFARRVAKALPATVGGVRVQGDPKRAVRTVAVCGGAGDSLLSAVRAAGADAYVTADLRHHRALESADDGGPALVDAAHWATEWPWLGAAATQLVDGVRERTGLRLRLLSRRWSPILGPLTCPPRSRSRVRHRGSLVNAPPETQVRLLDLQALDSTLAQLAHRRASLPEHAESERLSARLAEVRDAIVATETEESDVGREQAKAEGDVDQVVTRATRDQQRLDAGQVGSPRELENLQSEIASLARRRSDLEDTVLEIMERREDAQRRLADLVAEREQLTTDLATVEERRAAALDEIDTHTTKTTLERAGLAIEIPAELLSLYERIRDSHDGVGAAQLHRGRCEGCHLSLDASSLSALHAAPADAVVRCEECRRILIRTPESGL